MNLQSGVADLQSPRSRPPTAPRAASSLANLGLCIAQAPGQTAAAKLGADISATAWAKRPAKAMENPNQHNAAIACATPGEENSPVLVEDPDPMPVPHAAQHGAAAAPARVLKLLSANILADTAAGLLAYHPAFLRADYHRSTSLFVVIHQPVNLPMFDNHVDFCYHSPFGETGTKTERL